MCPKCGKKGYKYLRWFVNEHLGIKHKPHTKVQHREHDIYVSECYLGMGQL